MSTLRLASVTILTTYMTVTEKKKCLAYNVNLSSRTKQQTDNYKVLTVLNLNAALVYIVCFLKKWDYPRSL